MQTLDATLANLRQSLGILQTNEVPFPLVAFVPLV